MAKGVVMTQVQTWEKSAEKVFAEFWANKVISLFYLIVAGANLFSFATNTLGMKSMLERVLIASVVPVTAFCGLVAIIVWSLERFADVKFIKVMKEASREFFQIFEDDSFEESAEVVRITMKQRAWFIMMDYWAVFACIGVVALLNYLERSFLEVTIGTIIFDFVVAQAFMIYSLRTGQDITFGYGYRRAIDVIHRESKAVGYFGMVALSIKATIWDGPEQVPIFFKKELGGIGRMTALLVILAGFQGWFWAWLYSYGYESVMDAVRAMVA